jgi:hypothetical protein
MRARSPRRRADRDNAHVLIAVQDESLRTLFDRLRQFEGWRCWWRVPVAGLLYAAVPLFFVGATVLAAFIAGNDFELKTAIIAAVVGLVATGILAPRFARRQLHRRLIADRLWMYEKPNPRTEVQVLLRRSDLDSAQRALRRAKFHPGVYAVNLGSPPADALDLDCRMGVNEPEAQRQSSSDADRLKRVRDVLQGAGIRARVGGLDTLPSGRTEPDDGRATDGASEAAAP